MDRSRSRRERAGPAPTSRPAGQPRRTRLRRCVAVFGEAARDSNLDIDVGNRLRGLRTDKGLSLRLLAEMSGLNVNTLSLIENGRTSPSVSTLQQLARALDVPIAAFFEKDEMPQEVVFQKAGQRPRAAFAHGTADDLGAGMTLHGGQPLLVTLRPDTDSGPLPMVHTGYEFVYCLEGQLTYTIRDRQYALETGDSLIFEAHLPHHWGNAGPTVTRSLLILCPDDQNEDVTGQHFATKPETSAPETVAGGGV
jgi:transcriptional regulator with XRE-family HTH domain